MVDTGRSSQKSGQVVISSGTLAMLKFNAMRPVWSAMLRPPGQPGKN